MSWWVPYLRVNTCTFVHNLLSNEISSRLMALLVKCLLFHVLCCPHRKNFNLTGGRPTTSVTCFVQGTFAGFLSRCGWSGEFLLSHLTSTFSTVTPHSQIHTPKHTHADIHTCCYAFFFTNTHTHITCTHSFSLFMHHLDHMSVHFTNNK